MLRRAARVPVGWNQALNVSQWVPSVGYLGSELIH